MLEPPTPRRAARLLTSELAKLSKEDWRFVTALRERSTTIATAADLIGRFTSMVKDRTPAALDSWLHAAEASALATFAAGLRRDEDAVRAALSEPWSNGQVEGQINRLKLVKREMYGRAGFDLLRARVLGARLMPKPEEQTPLGHPHKTSKNPKLHADTHAARRSATTCRRA